MIDNIVVPVASSFGLGEDYNYLRRSIREFLTGRMYVIDTKTDPKAPFLHKVVHPEDIVQKAGLAYPHTSHCLASGDFFSVTQSLMSREVQ
ncbi:selenium-binding protein 2 [Rosa sericea]